MKRFVKKSLIMLLTAVMLVSMVPAMTAIAATALPEGAVAIGTVDELKAIATGNKATGAYYYLTQDITITEDTWTPLGTNDKNNAFYDILDGRGHTITFAGSSGTGVAMSTASTWNGGLFWSMCGDAVVKNLTIDGAITSGRKATGGLVGYLVSGTIDRCINKADITCDNTWVGGLAGAVGEGGVIVNCMNYGDVTAKNNEFAGGMAGYVRYDGSDKSTWKDSNNGAIKVFFANCANFGNITATAKVGGMVGLSEGGCNLLYRIQNCYNSGTMTCTGEKTSTNYGSMSCSTWSDSFYVEDCYATELLQLDGTSYDVTLVDDSNKAAVAVLLNSTIPAGGFTYYTTAEDATNATNAKVVAAAVWKLDADGNPVIMTEEEEAALGVDVPEGCVGIPIGTAAELKAIVTGSATGNRYYYLTNNITITDAAWTSLGSGDTDAFCDTLDGLGYTIAFAGADDAGVQTNGLFHTINGGVVRNVVTTGKVTVSKYGAGTLAGYMTAGRIDRCINRADVTGGQYGQVGGLVGSVKTGEAINCMNYGDVIIGELGEDNKWAGGDSVGGIVGYASYSTAMTDTDAVMVLIANCANFGEIKGENKIGGIIGLTAGGMDGIFRTENCYNIGAITSSGARGAIAVNQWADPAKLKATNCYALSSSCNSQYDKQGGTKGYIAPQGTVYMTETAMQADTFVATLNGNIPTNGFTYYTDAADATGSAVTVAGVQWIMGADGYPVIPTVQEEKQVTINFYGKYNEVFATKIVTSAEELDDLLNGGITAPVIHGYKFVSWGDVNDAEALYNANKGGSTTVIATYLPDEETTYSVTFGTGMTAVDGYGATIDTTATASLAFDKSIKVTAADTDKTVAYWVLDGAKVGIGKSAYTFYVSGNNKIEVVYTGEGVEVPTTNDVVLQQAFLNTNGDTYTFTVIAQTAIPDGGEITYGVLYSNRYSDLCALENDADSLPETGTGLYVAVQSTKTTANKQYMTSLLNVAEGKYRYARAYAIIGGKVIYSNTFAAVQAVSGGAPALLNVADYVTAS